MRWSRLDDEDIQMLVQAHLRGRKDAPPAFDDAGSTILSVALYVAYRAGRTNDEWIRDFTGRSARSPATTARGTVRVIHLEAWQPPSDAADEWYAHELRFRGVSTHFDLGWGLEAFSARFRAFGQPLPSSPAKEWGVPVVDRMAWKRWRTPPPMAIVTAWASAVEATAPPR